MLVKFTRCEAFPHYLPPAPSRLFLQPGDSEFGK
jgi:hypothetical protein